MARLMMVASVFMQINGVAAMCGFTTCKDSEVCCCNATSGQSGFCVDAGSDASVCTGSTMCPSGDSCCGKELEAQDTCPGVGQDCKVVGNDGLSCCGAEHGPGFAFCQTSPDYVCCSGASYAISCSSKAGCSVTDQGIPICQKPEELEAQDTCPGVGQDCKVVGNDGLSCCGAEHGPGFAFCQTSPDYECCSGASYAISCPSSSGCSVSDEGIPMCQKSLQSEAQDTCPGVGQDCKVVGNDGLSCCGAEHGPGFAFCQTSPDYVCCSGASYAISCSSKAGCSVTDQGIPICQKPEELEAPKVGEFVCHGVNYNITCGPQYTACCGEGTIAPLCMDAAGHSCCKDDELNLAVTCEKGQKCNKGPQCTAANVMV